MVSYKMLCVVVITVALVPVNNASVIMEKLKIMKGVLTKCSSESSFDIREFDIGSSIMSGKVESCVMACVIRDMDLLDGNQFDLGKIEENFFTTIPGFGLQQNIQSVRECIKGIEELGEGQEACINAEKFLKCLRK